MLDELAAELGGAVKVFRQHRDVRFSPDKSPYKTRTYGVAGDAPGAAGLYVEVSRAGLLVGGGYHVLAPDQLERFRAAVADNATGPALEAAAARARAAGVELYGEALKTAPRGYPRDHPRAALLRHRALFGADRLAPGPDGIGRDAALGHARATRAALADLSGWLDAHVGPATADDGRGRPGGRRRR
jgi:uncharacterized protein (TIGR02453 family)